MEVGGEASTSAATPARQLRERRESIKLAPKALPTDLRSFFGKVSPRKRALAESDEEGTQKSVARVGRRKVSSGSTSSADSKPKLATKPAKKMEQLFLDPFDTMGHATLSCAVCAMSYARTPEDMELHTKHHKKVVGGCDWVLGDAKGVTVLDEGVDWNENQGGKIVMVDAGAGGLVGKRVRLFARSRGSQVADPLCARRSRTSSPQSTPSSPQPSSPPPNWSNASSSSSSPLSARSSPAPSSSASSAPTASSAPRPSPRPNPRPTSSRPTSSALESKKALSFARTSSHCSRVAALTTFRSPDPLPTLLGVHRIWTSSSHRNAGLATLLLDAAAQRFIYGCPIPKQRRALDVAFSQPTGAGMALARSWTGTDAFRVFVE